jgi:hypothetical protein
MKMVSLEQHEQVLAEISQIMAGQIKAMRSVGNTMEEVLSCLEHDGFDSARAAVEFTSTESVRSRLLSASVHLGLGE